MWSDTGLRKSCCLDLESQKKTPWDQEARHAASATGLLIKSIGWGQLWHYCFHMDMGWLFTCPIQARACECVYVCMCVWRFHTGCIHKQMCVRVCKWLFQVELLCFSVDFTHRVIFLCLKSALSLSCELWLRRKSRNKSFDPVRPLLLINRKARKVQSQPAAPELRSTYILQTQ